MKRLTDPALRRHLELDSPSKPELRIQTFPYESVYTELQAICAALGPKDKVWICDKASRALTQLLPKVRESASVYAEDERYLRYCLFLGERLLLVKSLNLCCYLLSGQQESSSVHSSLPVQGCEERH